MSFLSWHNKPRYFPHQAPAHCDRVFYFYPMKHLLTISALTWLMAYGLDAQSQLSQGIPLPTIDVYESLNQVMDNHAIITLERKDIEALATNSVGDALEWMMGLDVRQRGHADVQSDLSIRGSSFDQVLILVNGVPYSDPQTGHHSMNIPVPLRSVERIELLSSGGSHRYGPFAFAGVINIVTLDGEAGYAAAGAGQYGLQRGSAGLSLGEFKGMHSRVDVAYKAADGQMTNRDYTQHHVLLRSKGNLSVGHLDLMVGLVGKQFGAHNFYTYRFPDQFEAIQSTSASVSYASHDGRLRGRVYGRQHLDHFELYREAYGYYQRLESGVFMHTLDSSLTPSWYSEHNNHRSRTIGSELTLHLQGGKAMPWTLDGGLDWRHDDIVSNMLGLDMTPIPAPDGRATYSKFDDRQNAGAYLTYAFRPIAPLRINLSNRVNWNSRHGILNLPGFSMGYHWNADGTHGKVHASINKGFRLPTFTDLYYRLGGAMGSADLQAEHAWNSEIGISQATATQKVTFNVYQRRGQNLIDWVYRNVDSSMVLQADNITAVTIQGLEASYAHRFQNIGYLQLQGSLASHEAHSGIDGLSIYVLDYLSSRFQVKYLTAPYHGMRLGWNLNWQDRQGSYIDADSQLPVAYSAFTTQSLRWTWSNDEVDINIDIHNLSNVSVIDRGNVPLPGRWISGGFLFHLN